MSELDFDNMVVIETANPKNPLLEAPLKRKENKFTLSKYYFDKMGLQIKSLAQVNDLKSTAKTYLAVTSVEKGTLLKGRGPNVSKGRSFTSSALGLRLDGSRLGKETELDLEYIATSPDGDEYYLIGKYSKEKVEKRIKEEQEALAEANEEVIEGDVDNEAPGTSEDNEEDFN